MAATTLLFGLWPALRASAEARSQHLRTTTPSKSTGRQTAALIAAQTALAVVLVAAGALFVRSLTALHAVDAGFRKERVLLSQHPSGRRRRRRGRGATHLSGALHALHEARRRSRGHAHARHAAWRQVGDRRDRRGRRPRARASRSAGALQHRRSEIPGDDGRADCGRTRLPRDRRRARARRRRLSARRLPGGCSAPTAPSADSSKRIHETAERRRRFEIVGVAADVRYESLRDAPGDTVYFTYFHLPEFSEELTFALKTDGNPLALVEAVRQQVREVSPRLPLYTVSSLDAKYDGSIATERMLATIAGFLGSLALLLVVCRCLWNAGVRRRASHARDGRAARARRRANRHHPAAADRRAGAR